MCTFPTQLSSRSRKDLICGIPKTLGCTQDTWTVPSTWSMIPSIRWTCIQNRFQEFMTKKTWLCIYANNRGWPFKIQHRWQDIAENISQQVAKFIKQISPFLWTLNSREEYKELFPYIPRKPEPQSPSNSNNLPLTQVPYNSSSSWEEGLLIFPFSLLFF